MAEKWAGRWRTKVEVNSTMAHKRTAVMPVSFHRTADAAVDKDAAKYRRVLHLVAGHEPS